MSSGSPTSTSSPRRSTREHRRSSDVAMRVEPSRCSGGSPSQVGRQWVQSRPICGPDDRLFLRFVGHDPSAFGPLTEAAAASLDRPVRCCGRRDPAEPRRGGRARRYVPPWRPGRRRRQRHRRTSNRGAARLDVATDTEGVTPPTGEVGVSARGQRSASLAIRVIRTEAQ